MRQNLVLQMMELLLSGSTDTHPKHFDCSLGQSQVYESLWVRLNEYDAQQREKAREHRKQYQAEFEAKRSTDPAYKESKRIYQQKHRKLKKEQLQAPVMKLVAIA